MLVEVRFYLDPLLFVFIFSAFGFHDCVRGGGFGSGGGQRPAIPVGNTCTAVSLFLFGAHIYKTPRPTFLLCVENPYDCRGLFQAALLYTSTSGQRRVRCHTIGLPATGVLASIFRSVG